MKVQAIINHSQGVFKKGDLFEVLGTKQGCCLLQYDIGIKSTLELGHCCECGETFINTNIWWMDYDAFRILRHHKPKINININKEVEETSDQIPQIM